MCGIVGYTGPREAGPILIEGLRRLEYRGYDSAGIALVDEQGDMFVEKKAGKLANLQTAIADRTPHAAIGLAHTRWATHGRPNDLNAHPHQDCTGEITVIHNGIIENFRDLRDGLEARGHTLTSETDTEAVAHLVEEAYQGDLADAVRATLRQLEGAYALVVMHKREQSRLVGARKDVPLVVGLHGEESFIASDVAAILAHTNRIIFLEEGDVADVRPDQRRDHRRRRGRPPPQRRPRSTGRRRPPRRAATSTSCSRRSTSSPRPSASRWPGRVTPDGRIQAPEVEGLEDAFRRATRVELVACGTASYAALVGAAAIQDWTGLPARVTVGSEFRYSPPPLDPGALVIAVTQSGETADTIAPTRWARRAGLPDRRRDQHDGLGDHPRGRRGHVPPGRPGDRRRGLEDVRHPGHHADRAGRGDRQGPRVDGRGARARAGPGAAGAARGAPRARWRRTRGSPRSPAGTSTRAGSCSSAAATRCRRRSRAR